MTYQEAISYIENYTWSSTRLGLERTFQLLEALGDPHRRLKFIHVAGSNGKGSTCAMLDAVLRAAGYRTGLYTSPYIQEFGERIRVNGDNISAEALIRITEKVKLIADNMEEHPSQFELVTAIAMEYFCECSCDIVVLEVGMGGALDSTNVIDAPEVAVITNIGLEHTEYLGDTLEKIAMTKAGIIKKGCHAVCYDREPVVTELVRKLCREKNVNLRCADFSVLEAIDYSLEGQSFIYKGEKYRLSLLGPHQLNNAATVLETVFALRERGWQICDDDVRQGLAVVNWPARLEVLGHGPLFILDGGHNPQCAQALTESLDCLLPNKKVVFLCGVLADKDYQSIIEMMLPLAQEFICLTPDSDRALPAMELAEYISRCGGKARAADNTSDGLYNALSAAGEEGTVVAFGSLYMAGAVRTFYRTVYRKWLRKLKIRARDSYTDNERRLMSGQIVSQILASPEFKSAQTVLSYRAVRGEVQLNELENAARAQGKHVVFPRCVSNTEMIALLPESDDAWEFGYCGIEEPQPEKSSQVQPEEIDLVLCPCTVFDEDCGRIGMGAGFYDRYLPKCVNACIALVAFEAQKTSKVPMELWDKATDMAYTEKKIYRK